jgi:hypothetical protein
MKSRFILFVLVLTLSLVALHSCSKQQTEALPEGIQKLIQQQTNCTCLPVLTRYRWKNQWVYVQTYRGPACNWTPSYYNEQGERISSLDNYGLDRFLGEATAAREVWRCQ